MTIQYYQADECYAQAEPLISGILNTIQPQSKAEKLWSLLSFAKKHATIADVFFFGTLHYLIKTGHPMNLDTCLEALKSDIAETLGDFAKCEAAKCLGDDWDTAQVSVVLENRELALVFDGNLIPFDNIEDFLYELADHIKSAGADSPAKAFASQQLEGFPVAPSVHALLADIAHKRGTWTESDTWAVLQSIAQSMGSKQYNHDTVKDHVNMWLNPMD